VLRSGKAPGGYPLCIKGAIKQPEQKVGKKDRFPRHSPGDLRKCEYCKGKNGKKKDIYETIQSAIDAAKLFEKERRIYLNAYRCPHGNGWHLTRNDADCEITERQESLFVDNDIPVKSSDDEDIAWEYIQPEKTPVENAGESILQTKKKQKTIMPIKKVECKSEDQRMTIAGKVMEIHKDINMEKYFKINFDNPFSALAAKEFLNKKINQITVHVGKQGTGQTESYTLLMEDAMMLKHKIVKGCAVTVELKAKIINHIKTWLGGAVKSAGHAG
jgi:hypothetical protein